MTEEEFKARCKVTKKGNLLSASCAVALPGRTVIRLKSQDYNLDDVADALYEAGIQADAFEVALGDAVSSLFESAKTAISQSVLGAPMAQDLAPSDAELSLASGIECQCPEGAAEISGWFYNNPFRALAFDSPTAKLRALYAYGVSQ